MSFEEPGDSIRCDHCNRHKSQSQDGTLYANRGERLCDRCLDASVTAQINDEGLRVIEDGRETVYRPGYITPRAYRYS